MSLRFHEISERNHRILNPLSDEKLDLLGEICRPQAGDRQLDLACGKAEMLCRWARKYGHAGVGVDVSHVFLAAARERAAELGVSDRVTLVHGDAGAYRSDSPFELVSCIGATWIGKGLVGTLELMKRALRPGGLLLVGEPYWIESPPAAARLHWAIGEEEYASLVGTLERIRGAGLELVEMVLANRDTWDRYVAAQWQTVDCWLRENPRDPDAAPLRDWMRAGQRHYLEFGRRYFGWGVFVLREAV